MTELFRTHDTADGIYDLSIKYESYDEFKKANEYARAAIDQYSLNETTTNYKYVIYFNTLSRTLVFDRMIETGG